MILNFCKGWDVTFKKISAQIAAVDLLAIYPVLFMLAGAIDVHVLLGVAAAMAVIKLIAQRVPQKTIATYNPETHVVVPKGPIDGFHEEGR